jgi:hypothetical protein
VLGLDPFLSPLDQVLEEKPWKWEWEREWEWECGRMLDVVTMSM